MLKILRKSYQSIIDKKREIVAMALTSIMTGQIALAAGGGGLGQTKTFLERFNGALHGLAIVVIVIAITLCGFKILFNGESVRDCKNIIIGAAFIVGAVEVTNMLYGK